MNDYIYITIYPSIYFYISCIKEQFFSWNLQPDNTLKVGGSLRWRDEGELEGKPRTNVQVYIDLLKMALPLALYTPSTLSLLLSLFLSFWMVFFVFGSTTRSPTD